MQKDLNKIEAAGVKVVGISYDSVDVLKRFADKQKITFPLLSDPESKTIIAYSIKNKEMAGRKVGNVNLDGVPYPGTFIVDKDGVRVGVTFVGGFLRRRSPERFPLVGIAAIQRPQVGYGVRSFLAPTHATQAKPLVHHSLAG